MLMTERRRRGMQLIAESANRKKNLSARPNASSVRRRRRELVRSVPLPRPPESTTTLSNTLLLEVPLGSQRNLALRRQKDSRISDRHSRQMLTLNQRALPRCILLVKLVVITALLMTMMIWMREMMMMVLMRSPT